MWIKKIEDYLTKYSEYDNNTLDLHVARDFITMLDSRVNFILDDDDATISIHILKYKDIQKEDCEVDEDGFMYWIQMNFHKELVDIMLSLRDKYTILISTGKKLQEEEKNSSVTRNKHIEAIKTNKSEIDKLKELMNKIESYRRHIFPHLKTRDDIDKIVTNIRILKEQTI